MNIHPTAVINKNSKIGRDVEIGPYCVIGGNVELAEGVKLHSHVCLEGYTKIGANTQIFPFASIGYAPQDLKFKGENSSIEIGKNNLIREYVTVHPGTALGNMQTIIGDNCLLMIGAHVAHDCRVGNNVIMANNATLGGHVVVGDFATLGGLAAVHQFVRIGAHAIIGGVSAVVEDVIPYGSAVGDRATLAGINIVGMKRRNFDRNSIHAVRNAFKILFLNNNDTLQQRVEQVANEYSDSRVVMEIIEFLRYNSSRSVCLPKGKL